MNVMNESATAQRRETRKHPMRPVRRREKPTSAGADPHPELAGFRAVEPGPATAPMFPLEPGTWLQPEFDVVAPKVAGIRIERRAKLAVPTFARIDAPPNPGRAVPSEASDSRPSAVEVVWPAGDLRLLGWDARAVLKSQEAS
jgi:hypothetical protein